MYDVLVIGAGVTGCAVARDLVRNERSVLVVDKASDVCEGTSKANSGIVHAGHDAKPGSLKARLNVRGSEMMPTLCKDLDIPFKNNGSLVLCFDESSKDTLNKLLEQGRVNGVKGLEILSGDKVREMEPNVSDEVVAALYAPTGGIIDPFNLTYAFAENAAVNGAQFKLNTEVVNIEKADEGYKVFVRGKVPGDSDESLGCAGGDKAGEAYFDEIIEAKVIVNAAGVYADKIHNMVSEDKLHITARKGEYCLMDKKVGGYVKSTLFQLPTKFGKGILVTPTVHGNLMTGPTAEDIEDKEAINTSAEGLDTVFTKAALSVKNLPAARNAITSFAGLRAHEDGGDFIIGEVADAKGFVDVAGIESPGLTSAPAIGEYVAEIINAIAPAPLKADFISTRKGIPCMATASMEEREQLIKENPLYANVICRCELVTEGEIVDAIRRPVGATTLDGVKRRTRAGMGRCQAGFCSPKTVEILSRELGKDMSEITKFGGESRILKG